MIVRRTLSTSPTTTAISSPMKKLRWPRETRFRADNKGTRFGQTGNTCIEPQLSLTLTHGDRLHRPGL